MIYEFRCENCSKTEERNIRYEDIPNTKCNECGCVMNRIYSCNFILKGWWPGKSISFNKEMTKRNEEAGERMRKTHKPMELSALDYGNGDVREVKK